MLIPTDDPSQFYFQDHVAVLADSGVWSVGVDDLEVVQLSATTVSYPYISLNIGMSPSGEKYAYYTGIERYDFVTPMLTVLDMEKQIALLELPLIDENFSNEDAFNSDDKVISEIKNAMQYSSLAWSPDERMLAFVGAIDQENTDIYLYDLCNESVIRLTNEIDNAIYLTWSPDGSYIVYMTEKNNFGSTVFDFQDVWVVDVMTQEIRLLNEPDGYTAHVFAWVDGETLLLETRGDHESTIQVVNIMTGHSEILIKGEVGGAAFNLEQKIGLLFAGEVTYPDIDTSENEFGIYAFNLNQSVQIVPNMLGGPQFGIEYYPHSDVFTLHGGAYHGNGEPFEICPEVNELIPYPAPEGNYWAWVNKNIPNDAYEHTLWVTENNNNPILVSSYYARTPAWSDDGQALFYDELDMLYTASAPDFVPIAVPGVIGDLWAVVN